MGTDPNLPESYQEASKLKKKLGDPQLDGSIPVWNFIYFEPTWRLTSFIYRSAQYQVILCAAMNFRLVSSVIPMTSHIAAKRDPSFAQIVKSVPLLVIIWPLS